jgi:DNA-directed RNA polymerase I subunit RPA1
VKQLLERKQGLFRMNMMGKRVNFTCRSVISPDPNIGTHEIGVPIHFARTLTYAEPITPWNVAELRQAVINGPSVHPGANMVQEASGELIDLSRRSAAQRLAIAKRLLVSVDADATPTKSILGAASAAATPAPFSKGGLAAAGGATPASPALGPSGGPAVPGAELGEATPGGTLLGRGGLRASSCKRVWRHLKSGDAMLVNRQPTLHKPGIMAHTARVLKGEKVIRMHYANCNTYNADFDGDEMNLHLVQNELARAEAYHIAATDHQYIAPTSGKPLRGLIQDHVGMGVMLTKRDTFLPRADVMQLLMCALGSGLGLGPKQKVAPLPPPAILKPAPLWTGKQVITHLLKHLHPNARRISMQAKTKTPASLWGASMPGDAAAAADDGEVIVRDGELLVGVLDKAAFGSTEFGLVHAVHEVLGGEATGRLLTQLGQLFNGCLKMQGVTCGIGDLLLTPAADAERSALIAKADETGQAAARGFLGATAPNEAAARQEMREVVRARLHKAGETGGAELDGAMKSKLMPLASDIAAACLPGGQQIPFPRNQFALMTSTGAKGSGVNFSQISAMLGQQELEGRRVPLSPTGCTAPCFAPHELGARAGGYITDRFLTGIRPPEFYFHCMAGREGLVDTAVKTSRSGYLQRCLIKHLEPLIVSCAEISGRTQHLGEVC